MVLEYMTGGSLHDSLHNATERTELDPLLLARVVSEVASGVAYLHSYGVMHRDVKVCGCPVSSPHSRANLSQAAPCATPPPPHSRTPPRLTPLPPSPPSSPSPSLTLSLPLSLPSPSPRLSLPLRRRPTCVLDDARHAKVTDFGISTRFGRTDYTAETGTYRQMAPEVILHKPYNYATSTLRDPTLGGAASAGALHRIRAASGRLCRRDGARATADLPRRSL